jgi:hypothetical protein
MPTSITQSPTAPQSAAAFAFPEFMVLDIIVQHHASLRVAQPA